MPEKREVLELDVCVGNGRTFHADGTSHTLEITALTYGPYIRIYIAITAPIYIWPLLPLHMAHSYIYMAVAAPIDAPGVFLRKKGVSASRPLK